MKRNYLNHFTKTFVETELYHYHEKLHVNRSPRDKSQVAELKLSSQEIRKYR